MAVKNCDIFNYLPPDSNLAEMDQVSRIFLSSLALDGYIASMLWNRSNQRPPAPPLHTPHTSDNSTREVSVAIPLHPHDEAAATAHNSLTESGYPLAALSLSAHRSEPSDPTDIPVSTGSPIDHTPATPDAYTALQLSA